MAHVQKPDSVFRRNGRVHLNRRGASVQSTTASRSVRISGSNSGYTMFRGSVKSTGYPLHSPVSPPLPLLCVTVCHHISTGVYRTVLLPNSENNYLLMVLLYFYLSLSTVIRTRITTGLSALLIGLLEVPFSYLG